MDVVAVEEATAVTKNLMARDTRRTLGPLGGVPVANESFWADGMWTNVYATNARKRYIAVRATSFVRLVYSSVGGSGDGSPSQSYVVRAGVDIGGGTFRRVLFHGRSEATVAPGGLLVSDAMPLALAAGAQFWVHSNVSGANLYYCGPPHGLSIPAWGEGSDAAAGNSAGDNSMGAIGTNSASQASPFCVVGDAGVGLPVVHLHGDSIMAGLGDGDSIVDAGRGFGRRAMANTIPFINTAVSGDTLVSGKAFRSSLAASCTDVLSNMGTNDVKNGSTANAVEVAMLAEATAFGAGGARVWKCTIPPHTTSTDTWATVGNQTITATESVRVAVNDWLRDGSPISGGAPVAVGTTGALRAGSVGHPIAGYFETADAVETSRNSGKWKVGSVYTTDATGLHPNSSGSALMAAAIDTTKFRG